MANLFTQGTNKRGLIVYNGEASADYGMVVSEAPSFERASRKQTVYQVPGRNGAVVFPQDAWNDVSRSYKVWIAETSGDLTEKINAFEAFLNSQSGYKRLEDSFEPNVYRLAYYSGGDSFSNEMMQYGEATIKFTCRPERFLKDGEQVIDVVNGSKVNNPTKFNAKPLIHIEGSGTVTINIGGKLMQATVSDYINIDCESMNAYRQTAENKNGSISGEFPVIPAGVNSIAITGTVTKCSIIPRWYTI